MGIYIEEIIQTFPISSDNGVVWNIMSSLCYTFSDSLNGLLKNTEVSHHILGSEPFQPNGNMNEWKALSL